MSQADQAVSTHRLDYHWKFASRIVTHGTIFLVTGSCTVGHEPGVVRCVAGAAWAYFAIRSEEQGDNARDSKVKVYLCRLYSFISNLNLDFILLTHPRITHVQNVLFRFVSLWLHSLHNGTKRNDTYILPINSDKEIIRIETSLLTSSVFVTNLLDWHTYSLDSYINTFIYHINHISQRL